MTVLIVESRIELGSFWQRHLQRFGYATKLAATQEEAIEMLRQHPVGVIILDLVIEGGDAMALADVASVLCPSARIIFVTNTSFFSDGSIFQFCANACAFVPSHTPPDDLAAMVEHYAGATRPEAPPDHARLPSRAQG